MVKPKMFISYRRDDPGNYTGQIYRWARDYFGRESVVIDVEAVEPGEDWLEAITRAVGESRVLLAVIGPQWAALAKSGEGRRDLGATGALVGALLGGSWRPPHVAYGLAAGAAAGVLAQLAVSPTNPGGGAVRVTLITGLVLIALAGVAMASDAAVRGRPARTDLPPPHAH